MVWLGLVWFGNFNNELEHTDGTSEEAGDRILTISTQELTDVFAIHPGSLTDKNQTRCKPEIRSFTVQVLFRILLVMNVIHCRSYLQHTYDSGPNYVCHCTKYELKTTR